jgi:hypothetical protein
MDWSWTRGRHGSAGPATSSSTFICGASSSVFRRREKQFLAKHSVGRTGTRTRSGTASSTPSCGGRLLQATARHQFRLKSGGAREDAGGRTPERGRQRVEEGRLRDEIGGRSSPLPSAAAELSPVERVNDQRGIAISRGELPL